MLPTYQVQLGMEPSYELSNSQKLLAQNKILVSITHLPRWIASLIIVGVLTSIIVFLKKKTKLLDFTSGISGFILSIVGIGVVLTVGLIVVAQLAVEEAPSSTVATMAMNNAITSQLATVPNWIVIMITVALAFIVLGYFYNMGAY
jgi:hypothetical protein